MTDNSVGNDDEEMKFSYVANGNLNVHNNFGKSFGNNCYKRPILWTSNSISSNISKRNECRCPPKHMYKKVHSTITNNILKMEPTHESINSAIYTLIYFNNEISEILHRLNCYVQHELQKYNDEQKKPDPQVNVLWIHLCDV